MKNVRKDWLPTGVGGSEVHSSLWVTLGSLALMVFGLSFTQPGFQEFRSVAATLPLVWLASLMVRIATQQLAIGSFARDMQMLVCPTGNLQTDYEFLPPRAVLAYAVSGQLASLGLITIGLVVSAAMSTELRDPIAVSQLLDFHGGWTSQAWATQILWVNIFLIGFNLLPALPFDTRALVFSYFLWRNQSAQEPRVFRSLSSLDSHLSLLMLGIGVSVALVPMLFGIGLPGWYAAIAIAVYLFVASQWESSRAAELDDQYLPPPTREEPAVVLPNPHFEFHVGDGFRDFDPIDLLANRQPAVDLGDRNEPGSGLHFEDLRPSVEVRLDEPIDVDDLLRKVHRVGLSSLTDWEREALLSASREMKEKRGST